MRIAALAALVCASAPALAETPRDMLIHAAFSEHSVPAALARIDSAQTLAAGTLRRVPGDKEAALVAAMAFGYRAKLTGSRTGAIAARRQFEQLVAQDPRDPERQLALGAWHTGAIFKLGRLMARAVLGAQKGEALTAIDRAVALSAGRASVTGLAALLRLELDPADAKGRALAETTARLNASTPLDQIMKRAAVAVLVPVHAGDTDATGKLAARLLPFGALDGAN
ncbi:hypothetical protein [Sphingomonas sp. EC-HK361]|uniref:hypothetical protein n=1 Tax=Sphingomonas sp. EC-HK361 TaxID=2038397 RepID=UPI001F1F1464|nr:hypothetical protein [Sphingomonas sp. EC-HK361]